MNFAAYITSQKMRIRAERADEAELITADGQTVIVAGCVCELRDSADILREIDGLCGLNKRERACADGFSRTGGYAGEFCGAA